MAEAAMNMRMGTKKVRISSKRQITIPQKFFTALGFDTEAECSVKETSTSRNRKDAKGSPGS